MTKREMAVAVANDVLAQLRKRTKGYVVTTGYYIRTGSPLPSTGDLRDHLDTIQKGGCQVCALGAALLSKARLYDKVPMNFTNGGYASYCSGDACYRSLSDVFSRKQMVLIESAFERMNMDPDSRRDDYTPVAIQNAIDFGTQYSDDKVRLRAIMKNIVENDGVFKPN